MSGIECWCGACDIVTQHYAGVCGTCVAHRAVKETVPFTRIGHERAKSRAASIVVTPDSRAIAVVVAGTAIVAAIVSFAL